MALELIDFHIAMPWDPGRWCRQEPGMLNGRAGVFQASARTRMRGPGAS